MSVQNLDGSPAELAREPANRFLHQLELQWAKGNPEKLQALAIVTLSANGWTMRTISKALGLEPSGGQATRLLNAAHNAIRMLFDETGPLTQLKRVRRYFESNGNDWATPAEVELATDVPTSSIKRIIYQRNREQFETRKDPSDTRNWRSQFRLLIVDVSLN